MDNKPTPIIGDSPSSLSLTFHKRGRDGLCAGVGLSRRSDIPGSCLSPSLSNRTNYVKRSKFTLILDITKKCYKICMVSRKVCVAERETR